MLLLGVTGAYLFRVYCYEGIYIASESMEPTLPVGRHVMVNKLTMYFNKPERGEIVMFESPIDNKKGMVKRVIAGPGDTIEMRDKKVYLNNRRLDEPYVQFLKPDTIFRGDNWAPVVVPEDSYFVMGDNRDVSGDSRDWKSPTGEPNPFLPLSKIKGVVQLQ